MLRGPPNTGRTETPTPARLYEFETLEEVQEYLDKTGRQPTRLYNPATQTPGQKGSPLRPPAYPANLPNIKNGWNDEPTPTRSSGGLEARVTQLEKELSTLRERFWMVCKCKRVEG